MRTVFDAAFQQRQQMYFYCLKIMKVAWKLMRKELSRAYDFTLTVGKPKNKQTRKHSCRMQTVCASTPDVAPGILE